MTAEETSIRNAYESEGMSPDQIAECQGLDTVAVKACLMQYSAMYRKACGAAESEDDGLNFNDDDLRRMNNVIRDIALSAEDENLRFKAATYIRNDKKGRLEPQKQLAGQNFNILMINEKLKGVRQMANQITSSVRAPRPVSNTTDV